MRHTFGKYQIKKGLRFEKTDTPSDAITLAVIFIIYGLLALGSYSLIDDTLLRVYFELGALCMTTVAGVVMFLMKMIRQKEIDWTYILFVILLALMININAGYICHLRP